MAEKIKKTYTTGDKTFDTYAEAVVYRKTLTSPAVIRERVADLLRYGVNWADADVDDAVHALLAAFDIKPKRAGK